jgi:hypothetical protein
MKPRKAKPEQRRFVRGVRERICEAIIRSSDLIYGYRAGRGHYARDAGTTHNTLSRIINSKRLPKRYRSVNELLRAAQYKAAIRANELDKQAAEFRAHASELNECIQLLRYEDWILDFDRVPHEEPEVEPIETSQMSAYRRFDNEQSS